MRVTRRAVVSSALAAPGAMALQALDAPAWAAATGPWARATWTPWVGHSFRLETEKGSARAVLASVEDLTGAPAGARHRFSLMFTAATELPQGIVTVRRRGCPAVALFVSPVDRGVTAQHRQAVVNTI